MNRSIIRCVCHAMLRRLFLLALLFLPLMAGAESGWRYAQWRGALDAAAKVETPAAAAEAWAAAGEAETVGKMMALRRWTQLDPAGACAAMVAKADWWHAAEVLRDWAFADPGAAGEAWFPIRAKFRADAVPQRFESLRDAADLPYLLAYHLARKSPEEALAMARRLGQDEEAFDFRRAALAVLAREKPESMLKLIAEDDLDEEELVIEAGCVLGRRDLKSARKVGETLARPRHRIYFQQGMLAARAEKEPREALEEAWKREQDGAKRNSEDPVQFSAYGVFRVAVELHPEVAMRWVAQLDEDDQAAFCHPLGKEMDLEAVPGAARIAKAAKAAGLKGRAEMWIETGAEHGDAGEGAKPLEFADGATAFERSLRLAQFLDGLKADDFPAAWRASFWKRDVDREWLQQEHKIMLQAWTTKDPDGAFHRAPCEGIHERAAWGHYSGSVEVLTEWVAHGRASFLVSWEKGLALPDPYDEANALGRLGAAAIAADAWAERDPVEAWIWYAGVAHTAKRPPSIGDPGYLQRYPLRFPTKAIERLAARDLDTAFRELNNWRVAAKDALDEAALRSLYRALGAQCRQRKVGDVEKRIAELPHGDQMAFLSGFEGRE